MVKVSCLITRDILRIDKTPARKLYCGVKRSKTEHCESKGWQFRFRKAEIASAHLLATRRFSPGCLPLPARGIVRILCKMMIYNGFSFFCTGRATKKEPRMRFPLKDCNSLINWAVTFFYIWDKVTKKQRFCFLSVAMTFQPQITDTKIVINSQKTRSRVCVFILYAPLSHENPRTKPSQAERVVYSLGV